MSTTTNKPMTMAAAIRAAVKSGGTISLDQLHAGVEALLEKSIGRKKLTDNAYQMSRAGDIIITGKDDGRMYSVGKGKPVAAKRKTKPANAAKAKPAPRIKSIKQIADTFAQPPMTAQQIATRHVQETLAHLLAQTAGEPENSEFSRALSLHRNAVALAVALAV